MKTMGSNVQHWTKASPKKVRLSSAIDAHHYPGAISGQSSVLYLVAKTWGRFLSVQRNKMCQPITYDLAGWQGHIGNRCLLLTNSSNIQFIINSAHISIQLLICRSLTSLHCSALIFLIFMRRLILMCGIMLNCGCKFINNLFRPIDNFYIPYFLRKFSCRKTSQLHVRITSLVLFPHNYQKQILTIPFRNIRNFLLGATWQNQNTHIRIKKNNNFLLFVVKIQAEAEGVLKKWQLKGVQFALK